MILFASQRSFNRAENIRALFDAYTGEKEFARLNILRFTNTVDYRVFGLMVTDEMPACTTGKCLMIGHGGNGLKLFGFDQPFPYVHEDERGLITKAVCASEGVRELTAKAYGISVEDVLPLGMPRTDALIKGAKKTTKRTYLYAPTYRTQEEQPHPFIDWEYIDNQLTDNEELIYKPHMMTGDISVNGLKHIKAASAHVPSTDYIINCDVLITDYSSIMFDAMIVGKPVVLFAKDKDHYKKQRGFYFPYPSAYSSRFCDNEKELIDLIRQDGLRLQDIRARRLFVGACDGHSCDRVIELMGAML